MSYDIVNPGKYLHVIEDNHIQMSPAVLAVLNEFIRDRQSKLDRPFKLLEFGSGASTSYWSKEYPEIELYSIEGDKDWYEQVKRWAKPKIYEFHEATNYYTSDPKFNKDYVLSIKKFGPFDLIINDGAMREIVGEFILDHFTDFVSEGGMYLRHDYEMAITGNWVGFNQTGEVEPLNYEKFVANHPEYSLITINGNGKWGYKAELGGIWRR